MQSQRDACLHGMLKYCFLFADECCLYSSGYLFCHSLWSLSRSKLEVLSGYNANENVTGKVARTVHIDGLNVHIVDGSICITFCVYVHLWQNIQTRQKLLNSNIHSNMLV